MHTTGTTPKAERAVGLTQRGRVRAILIALEQRWPQMTYTDRAEALHLLNRLADVYRRTNG